ncbi:MAG: ATP-binding protein, partial [Pseudomonadales bacterium]|nr:ATP-binding protein [Pseudomonadales bacterium]
MNSFEQYLPQIIKSLKATYGADFFNSLTLQLNQVIGADYTFIAKLDAQRNTSQTISLVSDGEILDNFEYSLHDTPCADVSGNAVCIHPENIAVLYPNDLLLIEMGIEGYIGTPLQDSAGCVTGIVVALYKHKIKNADFIASLFELFSGRISAEIEREEKQQQLTKLNATLEEKVKLRTAELSDSIENLLFTQDQLIEQEKMASLGGLVAGVAHEINTPLGVAVLSSSIIKETLLKLSADLEKNTLSKYELQHGLQKIKKIEQAMSQNLSKAATLVKNFKQVAVDSNSDDLATLDLIRWLPGLVASLKPTLNNQNINITTKLPNKKMSFVTCPAHLSQVISNIVSNCAMHAFDQCQETLIRQIQITLKTKSSGISLSISDNGMGITKDIQRHMFEPFYTTKRGKGGKGLGL